MQMLYLDQGAIRFQGIKVIIEDRFPNHIKSELREARFHVYGFSVVSIALRQQYKLSQVLVYF